MGGKGSGRTCDIDRMEHAALLLAAGQSKAAVARAIDRTPRIVDAWLKRADFLAILEEHKGQVRRENQGVLRGLVAEAWKKVRQALAEDESGKLAMTLLEKTGALAQGGIDVGFEGGVNARGRQGGGGGGDKPAGLTIMINTHADSEPGRMIDVSTCVDEGQNRLNYESISDR